MSIGNDSKDGSRRALNGIRECGPSMKGAVEADVVARLLLPTSPWLGTGSMLGWYKNI